MKSISASLLSAFMMIVGIGAAHEVSAQAMDNNESPPQMKVILERVYLDGEISEETVTETIWAAEDFWAKYEDWKLVDMDEGYVVFRQQTDDISPLLKANGYFGITDEGILTIFNGKPQRTNIIQSFFQIDIQRLESNKCEQLKKGIPIMTKDRYIEVLETFKTYSTDDKVLN
ncbi:intercompartmental signaling factor BofC [Cytobacillus gottheilii]|uniref:intercompartmental signaling factor BofC n=1 Tax=Cytobacillus gottheilii TaxID=859144 RepID=UPI0009EE882D|nr:intercompartmental signaling factor BofC [Cytobacillus gottheilii]